MLSSSLGPSIDAIDPGVLFFGPIVVLATACFVWLHRRRRQIAARSAEVERVAREVAAVDPAFEPEKLLADAGALFHEVMHAWREKDVEFLRDLTGPELGAEWERKLRDSGNSRDRKWYRLRDVQYAGLVNASDDDGDWVVVRLVSDHARMPPHHDLLFGVGASTRQNGRGGWRLTEHWALGKRADRWVVVAVRRETLPGRGPEHPIVPFAEQAQAAPLTSFGKG